MLLFCCQVVSNWCVYVQAFVLCFCGSRTIAGLTGLTPWGRRNNWTDGVTGSPQNHSPGSETEKEALTQTEVFRVERSVWQSGKHSDKDTRKEWTPAWPLKLQTSRLWLTDRLWAEDGVAVTAPHQANWLAKTGSVFPTPWGLNEELPAIPISAPRSGLAQREN